MSFIPIRQEISVKQRLTYFNSEGPSDSFAVLFVFMISLLFLFYFTRFFQFLFIFQDESHMIKDGQAQRTKVATDISVSFYLIAYR